MSAGVRTISAPARSAFASLLPAAVACSEWTPERGDAPLHPDEARAVARSVARRRREYAAGRACAREALARLGVGGFALLPGPGRAPLWPDGIVGSISHTEGHCAAAVARSEAIRGIGIDVELAAPLPTPLLRIVATPGERRAIDALGSAAIPWATVLFSAKESVFKCYYPIARRYLDFADVAVQLHPRRAEFVACLAEPHARLLECDRVVGRFRATRRHVFTAVALRARDRDRSSN